MSEWRSHRSSATSAGAFRAAADTVAATVAADNIHRQLDRILESPYFQTSLRLTRFLRFVVETTLAGKPETIKAYTIAVDALGRGQDFDPQRDPIVRVEAGRLRAALARYYAEEGRHDALVIEVPRGSYVPVFRRPAAIPLATIGNDTRALGSLFGRRPNTAARPRESEILHETVFRQSHQLAAEISIVRSSLADPQALLQQPFPNIDSDPAQPPTPAPATSSAELKAANGEGVAQFERTSHPQLLSALSEGGPTLTFAAAAKCHLRKFVPALRIALYVIAILAILQVTFDIDQPLTGGANDGLFFRIWGLQTSHAR